VAGCRIAKVANFTFCFEFNWQLSRVLLLLFVSFLWNTDISITFYLPTFKHHPVFTRWLINYSFSAFRYSLAPLTLKRIGAILNMWSSIHRMARMCWSINVMWTWCTVYTNLRQTFRIYVADIVKVQILNLILVLNCVRWIGFQKICKFLRYLFWFFKFPTPRFIKICWVASGWNFNRQTHTHTYKHSALKCFNLASGM